MDISELMKKAKISHSQDESQGVINPEKKASEDKLDQILAELKALNIVFSTHDQHLTTVDNKLTSLINELLERRKDIPKGKKVEAERIISKAKTMDEAIEKLKSIGISQATAYRYTERFENGDKK